MPKTEAKFGAELQTALQPMIVKPSGGILVRCQAFDPGHRLSLEIRLCKKLLRACVPLCSILPMISPVWLRC